MSDKTKRWRSELTEADARTLRLASPPLSPEKLDQVVRYQRAWLEAILSGAGGEAEWRERALKTSQLTTAELPTLEAMVRAFAGSRWTRRRLAGHSGMTGDLAQDRDLEELRRRYGADAIVAMSHREAELVELHEAIRAAIRPVTAS